MWTDAVVLPTPALRGISLCFIDWKISRMSSSSRDFPSKPSHWLHFCSGFYRAFKKSPPCLPSNVKNTFSVCGRAPANGVAPILVDCSGLRHHDGRHRTWPNVSGSCGWLDSHRFAVSKGDLLAGSTRTLGCAIAMFRIVVVQGHGCLRRLVFEGHMRPGTVQLPSFN